MKKILEKIKKYDTIIIHRHIQPDFDAYGSQLGLALTLKENFKEKNIYVVGEENYLSYVGKMDTIEDSVFTNALCIILDVSNAARVSDNRFTLAKDIVVIDHHQNTPDIDGYCLVQSDISSCCQIVTNFIYESKLKMTSEAATMLFSGIIADTGRFLYSKNDPTALFTAAKLLEDGAESKLVYDSLTIESLEKRKLKSYLSSQIKYYNNVAYLCNDKDVFDKFDVSTFEISRGMVNLMAGIDEVSIWANFTYDIEQNKVLCEFRSREIPIVDIAVKYGGGGHKLACGASLENFDKVQDVINDFDELLKKEGKNV